MLMAGIGCIALLVVPLRAETPPKALRVGMATIAPRSAPHIVAFVNRMTELGYHEGVDFLLEHVPVAAIDGYDAGFQELAARHIDIFVALGNEPAVSAARTAADGKPIVMIALTFDPVKKGFAASLAHRGSRREHHRALRSAGRARSKACPTDP
jgi:hypothetical protein